METPSFIDGLGHRFTTGARSSERLETLRLCAEMPATPENQAALVERATSLAHFEHDGFARVRRIEQHGAGPRAALAIVSEAVDGVRLSDLLRESERRRAERDVDAAMQLLLQVAGSVAALHRQSPDAAHGAIGPERLVVRADGSLVLVEHVLGGALEALQFSRLQLWALFRVPAPVAASTVRFDQQTDVLQLGVVALALLLGRVLRREEFPHALPAVLEEASSPDAGRNYAGCPRAVRAWIARTLQFEARSVFRSAPEAERALVRAVREEGTCRPSIAAVQRFLAGCSFGSLGPLPPGADVRVSSSGAMVSVGWPDRGSGAHRVSRQPAADLTPPHVIADFPPAAPEDDGIGGPAPAVAPAEGPILAQADGPPRRNWLSRLLPR